MGKNPTQEISWRKEIISKFDIWSSSVADQELVLVVIVHVAGAKITNRDRELVRRDLLGLKHQLRGVILASVPVLPGIGAARRPDGRQDILAILEVNQDVVALDVVVGDVVGLDDLEGLEDLTVDGQILA